MTVFRIAGVIDLLLIFLQDAVPGFPTFTSQVTQFAYILGGCYLVAELSCAVVWLRGVLKSQGPSKDTS